MLGRWKKFGGAADPPRSPDPSQRGMEWGLLPLGLLLFWAGVATRSPLLIGSAAAWLLIGQLGRFRHRGQAQALFALGVCVALAFSSEPSRTWWVAGVFGLVVGWAGATPLWRGLGALGALLGMGVPSLTPIDLLEHALRLCSWATAAWLVWRQPAAEQAAAQADMLPPVPLENLSHPRFLPQRLSLYLQQHLARVQSEGVVLYLYDLRAGALDAVLRLGALPDLIKQRVRVPMGDGMVGVCAATGRPIAFLSLLKPPPDLPRNVVWEGAPSLCLPLFDPSSPSGRPLGVLQLVGNHLTMDALPAAQSLSARIAEALATVRRREAEQLANFQKLSAIVAQVEEQSPHTRGHSHRVAALCDLLAEELGLEPELREKLRIAALFHDIGKTRVPPEILNKEGALTDEEKLQIRRYPLYSVEICSGMGFDEDVLFLIRHHGERLDGSGYPDGLDAARQPLALRILQVADVFDTLACTRAYREALTTEQRLRELSRMAGTKLDILVIETLRRAHLQGRLEPIYNELLRTPQELSTGMLAA